jgi:hypothetical protein
VHDQDHSRRAPLRHRTPPLRARLLASSTGPSRARKHPTTDNPFSSGRLLIVTQEGTAHTRGHRIVDLFDRVAMLVKFCEHPGRFLGPHQ